MKKKSNLVVGLLLAMTLLVAVFLARSYMKPEAQKSYVVGIVSPNPKAKDIVRGFKEGLAGYGYQEGENVTYIVCDAKDCMDSAMGAMVAQKVDLIFTHTTPATKKVQKATKGSNIPVVFVMNNSVASGVLKAPARPDANLTGVEVGGSTGKALEWLLKITPEAKRIFVPIKFDTPAGRQGLAALQAAGERLGVDLLVSEVHTGKELEAALASMPEDIDAIFLLRSFLVSKETSIIVAAAVARRLPSVDDSARYKEGTLVSYSPSRFHIGKQASRMAQMILKGKAVAGLPVERPDFFLGINLKTAAAAGIHIPDDMLLMADEIIR